MENLKAPNTATASCVAIFKPYKFNGISPGPWESVIDAGPFKLDVLVTENAFELQWYNGKQTVKRVWFPQKRSSWVLCPACGKKTYRLFSVDGAHFTCQKCAGLHWGYDQWHISSKVRQPKKPKTWLKWYLRRAAQATSTKTKTKTKGGKTTTNEKQTQS